MFRQSDVFELLLLLAGGHIVSLPENDYRIFVSNANYLSANFVYIHCQKTSFSQCIIIRLNLFVNSYLLFLMTFNFSSYVLLC